MSKKGLTSLILFFFAALFVYPQIFSIRAGAGIMRPQEDSFKEIYGNCFPLSLEVNVRLSDNYGLAVGLDWINEKGKALPLDQGGEEFLLHFKMISIPVSVFYEFSGRLGSVPLGIDLGLGVNWHSYKESWETAELISRGKKLGLLVYGTVDFRLFSRVALFTSLRYESVPTGKSSLLNEKINLGGVKLLTGIAFYLN